MTMLFLFPRDNEYNNKVCWEMRDVITMHFNGHHVFNDRALKTGYIVCITVYQTDLYLLDYCQTWPLRNHAWFESK